MRNFRNYLPPIPIAAIITAVTVIATIPVSAQDVAWLAEVNARVDAPADVDCGRIEFIQLPDSTGSSSLAEWSKQRSQLHDDWLKFLGPMPDPRPDVLLEVLSTEQLDDVQRQLVRYEGEPDLFVEGYLLMPTRAVAHPQDRFPAVLALHPTTDKSIDEIAGVSGPDEKQVGWKLAQRGFIVFCPRCFLWQATPSYDAAVAAHRQRHPQTLGMSKMLYDAMRGVDVLVSLPQVDPNRIGAVGHSLGAKEALYVAAFDDRIKAAVSSEGGLCFSSTNWDAPWYLGNAIHEPDLQLNHHQLLAMIAPRPFLLLGGESGPGAADGERSRAILNAARPVWELYGEPVRLGFFNHHHGHSMPPAAFDKLAEWLDVYLARR